MIDRRAALGLLATSPLLTAAQAAELTAAQAARDAPDPTEVIALWPGDPPGLPAGKLPEEHVARDPPPGVRDRYVARTRNPTLTVFRPERPNGSAVLIAPGGGYIRVVRDKEGYEAARYLASRGYTCFVLIYRLPTEPWAAGANVALQDAQRALRLIRTRAGALGLDVARVGVMGFSAGGHVAASLATRYGDPVYQSVDAADRVSARPDFAGLIYPVIALTGPLAHRGSAEAMAAGPIVPLPERVTAETPPTFILHAQDDASVPVGNALLMFDALKAAGVPVEMHLFEEGGHGFGLRAIEGKPVERWPDLFASWLAARVRSQTQRRSAAPGGSS